MTFDVIIWLTLISIAYLRDLSHYVRLGYYTKKFVVLHHRKAAHIIFEHDVRGNRGIFIGSDGKQLRPHDIFSSN